MKKYLLASLLFFCCTKEELKSIKFDRANSKDDLSPRRRLSSINAYSYNYNLESELDTSQFLSVDQNDYLVTTTLFDNYLYISKKSSDDTIIWEKVYYPDSVDKIYLHTELRYLSSGNYILVTQTNNSLYILDINSINGEIGSTYQIDFNDVIQPKSFIIDEDTLILISVNNTNNSIMILDYKLGDEKAKRHKYEQPGEVSNPYIVNNYKLNGYMIGFGNNDDKYSFQFVHLNSSFYPIWKKDISTHEDIYFKALFKLDHTKFLALGDIINQDDKHNHGIIMLIDENAIVRKKEQVKIMSASNSLTKYLSKLSDNEYQILGNLVNSNSKYHPFTINIFNNGSIGKITKFNTPHQAISMVIIGNEVIIDMMVDHNKYQLFNRYSDISFSCINTTSLQRQDADLTNEFDLSSEFDLQYSLDSIAVRNIEYFSSNTSLLADYTCNNDNDSNNDQSKDHNKFSNLMGIFMGMGLGLIFAVLIAYFIIRCLRKKKDREFQENQIMENMKRHSKEMKKKSLIQDESRSSFKIVNTSDIKPPPRLKKSALSISAQEEGKERSDTIEFDQNNDDEKEAIMVVTGDDES